ncbi:ABC transporter ATP-binding protein [Massilia sp. W12]|uniref:ABC transporter ATP-binding protein n=1 Tax=Massilia sp. W12 TaxID=3126507 RepID=UPI0030D4DFD4
MNPPLLQVDALRMSIAGRCLWQDLDWQVEAGECWAILGRNGAGKSSLMRCLAGIACPDQGQIAIRGKNLAQWPLLELARQRAFLPQSRNDPFGYSVLQAVQSARHPWQTDAWWQAEDHSQALQALAQMEVEHLAARDVRSLSGGERQRVAIAALLAQDTPLLLLDEPAAALDLAHQMSVTDTLARLCRAQQRAVVMVGHDINLALRCASHVLLLYGDGRWQAGPCAQVMQVDIIGDCLGYPLAECEHLGRRVFLPL